MKVIKKTAEYTVYQKRSGRYAVTGADGKAINEDDKVAILLAEDLIKAPAPKAPEIEEASEAEAAEEAPAEKELVPEVEAAADEAGSEEAAKES
ncbi:MAG: hypothetical protein KUG71_07200 [Porticoccaceae bacterium]|nr:hypothetical protein [Porticoccaceae bacterium]